MTGESPIEFRSDDDRVALLLSYHPTDADFGHIAVEIRADGITCRHAALSLRGDGLGTFLRGLVADWGGWDGTRRWDALGPELRIEASHRGHAVELLFIVRRDDRPDAWQVRLPLLVDPGEPLSRLAKASVTMFDD